MFVVLLLGIDKASPGLGNKFSPQGYLLKAAAILNILVIEGVGNFGQGYHHLDLAVALEICQFYYQTWERICSDQIDLYDDDQKIGGYCYMQ